MATNRDSYFKVGTHVRVDSVHRIHGDRCGVVITKHAPTRSIHVRFDDKRSPKTGWISPDHLKKSNPAATTAPAVDPNTKILVIGTALVGTAVTIALLLLATRATASTTTTTTTTGQTIPLGVENANATQSVLVGEAITISLEGSWSVANVVPSGVLGVPVRSTSSTGISDTYPVVAAGLAAITYINSSNGTSTVFNVAATVAT